MIKEIPIIDFYPKPEPQRCIICYIDLLGTKNNIDTSNSKDEFECIYNAFEMAMCVEAKMKIFGELQFKIFSDNILIVHSVDSTDDIKCIYEAYRNLSHFLKSFLLDLISKGLLCRGGITFGEIAIDEIMVWGKGLSEVVKLEENVAVYPRIIISPKLIKIFNDFGYDEYKFEEKFSCLIDVDGSIYFDYVDYGTPPDAEKLIIESQSAIVRKRENETDLRILQKYNWHLNYLKRAKEIFIEYYGRFPL